jgi:GNAT superfamily N-acetyltransferase
MSIVGATQVTTWYLQMHSPDALRGKSLVPELQVIESEIPQVELNRFLYRLVGAPWQWTDRLVWSDRQWRDYVESPGLQTWVAWYRGSPAGYFELLRDADAVQIAYFGLAPAFVGHGLGGPLLSEALRQAWQWRPVRRVWVHTCSLDHPHALANYLARGMRLYRQETFWRSTTRQ